MPERNRSRSVRATTLTVLASVVVLVATAPQGFAGSQSDTVNIDPGSHAAVEIDFRDGPTMDVTYDVQVNEGPNIDVMVLDNANYQRYNDGQSFSYIEDWSDLDTGNTGTTFRLDTHGTWWLVLDHTGEPDGGAQPATIGAESVTARYTVETKTNVTDTARDTLEGLPAPGAVAVLPAIGLAAVALARQRQG